MAGCVGLECGDPLAVEFVGLELWCGGGHLGVHDQPGAGGGGTDLVDHEPKFRPDAPRIPTSLPSEHNSSGFGVHLTQETQGDVQI